MLKRNDEVLRFLLSRRSHAARLLTDPIPDHENLTQILEAASRVPDHGKLEPWRFLILEKQVMVFLAEKVEEIGIDKGIDRESLQKNKENFINSPLIVTVVFSPKPSQKIPLIEQQLSAGAVCLSLLNAAHAAGWGANWLTGWMAHEQIFLRSVLDLKEGEFVAGFIHIGTAKSVPTERVRPRLDLITSSLKV